MNSEVHGRRLAALSVALAGGCALACSCPRVDGPTTGLSVSDFVLHARAASTFEMGGGHFVRFEVAEGFKGAPMSQELVALGGIGCDPTFVVGKSYFVFALKDRWPLLGTTVCLPTTEEGAADTAFLSAWVLPRHREA